MGKKLPHAAVVARAALRERQRHLEDLVTAWWCADADRRDALDRLEVARHSGQERVDACAAECERLCHALVDAGMAAADVATMTEQNEKAVNDLLRRAIRHGATVAERGEAAEVPVVAGEAGSVPLPRPDSLGSKRGGLDAAVDG